VVRHSGLELPPVEPRPGRTIFDAMPGRRQDTRGRTHFPPPPGHPMKSRSPPSSRPGGTLSLLQREEQGESLYNEGWGSLTCSIFESEYPTKFSQFVHAVAGGGFGASPAENLWPAGRADRKRIPGVSARKLVSRRPGTRQTRKGGPEEAAQPVHDLEIGVVLTDLLNRSGKEPVYQAVLERLAARDPKRAGAVSWSGFPSHGAPREDAAAVK
jgi:hypothetical protein